VPGDAGEVVQFPAGEGKRIICLLPTGDVNDEGSLTFRVSEYDVCLF